MAIPSIGPQSDPIDPQSDTISHLLKNVNKYLENRPVLSSINNLAHVLGKKILTDVNEETIKGDHQFNYVDDDRASKKINDTKEKINELLNLAQNAEDGIARKKFLQEASILGSVRARHQLLEDASLKRSKPKDPQDKIRQLLDLAKENEGTFTGKIFLEQASRLGCPEATFKLGKIEAEEGNIHKATRLFEQAAELGHRDAQKTESHLLYLEAYRHANEGKFTEAIELYKEAANNGHLASTREVYFRYSEGEGVEKNEEQAKIYAAKIRELENIL